jgi:hypothetical protein
MYACPPDSASHGLTAAGLPRDTRPQFASVLFIALVVATGSWKNKPESDGYVLFHADGRCINVMVMVTVILMGYGECDGNG